MPTDNFALATPDEGTNPGGATLNANWELIDSLLAAALRFRMGFSGTLQTGQNALIFKERPPKGVTLRVTRFRVVLQTAPTGQAAKFSCYKNGVFIAQVTVAVGTKYADATFSVVSFGDTDEASITIDQVGSGVAGATATFYLEAA